MTSASRRASSERGSVAIGGPIVASFAACSWIAATTFGCEWPIVDVDELRGEVEIAVAVVVPEVAALGVRDRHRADRALHRPAVEHVLLVQVADALRGRRVRLRRRHCDLPGRSLAADPSGAPRPRRTWISPTSPEAEAGEDRLRLRRGLRLRAARPPPSRLARGDQRRVGAAPARVTAASRLPSGRRPRRRPSGSSRPARRPRPRGGGRSSGGGARASRSPRRRAGTVVVVVDVAERLGLDRRARSGSRRADVNRADRERAPSAVACNGAVERHRRERLVAEARRGRGPEQPLDEVARGSAPSPTHQRRAPHGRAPAASARTSSIARRSTSSSSRSRWHERHVLEEEHAEARIVDPLDPRPAAACDAAASTASSRSVVHRLSLSAVSRPPILSSARLSGEPEKERDGTSRRRAGRRRRRRGHTDQPLDRRPQRRRGVGPHRPGLQPRHRPADRRGRLRLRRGGRPRGAGRARGVRGVALALALPPHRALLPHPPARARQPRGDREDPHGRARQGPLRRDGRGRARARGDRVLLRDAGAPQGRLLRAGLHRDRRLLDPAAARRRRRDHAVQLPGDGAHVDVGAGARLREHVRPQAVREGPVRVALRRGAARPRRASRPASSTSSTATRSRSTRCSSIRASRRSRSSARRRSRATSTRPRRSTASAARRSAARRTT